MPPTHRKLRRKELRRPDEFMTFVEQAQDFFLKNLRQVIISAAIVLGVAAIAFAVFTYEQHRDYQTAARFNKALDALNAKRYVEAEQGFAKLAGDEPGRRLGRLARFYLGNAYLEAGDLPHARDAYTAFIAEEHDPAFSSLAMTDLAVVYEKMGDYTKAIGAYSQAASVSGPEQARAELGVARMLAKAGNNQGAIDAYRRFLAAHPYALQRQDVVESLAMLGAPAEASTPPPPGTTMPVIKSK